MTLLLLLIGAAGIVYLVLANDKSPMTQLLLMLMAAAGVGYILRGASAAVVAVLLVGAVLLARRRQWGRFLWRAVVAALVVGDIFRPMVMRHLHDFGKLPAPVPASAQRWAEDSAVTAVPPPR